MTRLRTWFWTFGAILVAVVDVVEQIRADYHHTRDWTPEEQFDYYSQRIGRIERALNEDIDRLRDLL